MKVSVDDLAAYLLDLGYEDVRLPEGRLPPARPASTAGRGRSVGDERQAKRPTGPAASSEPGAALGTAAAFSFAESLDAPQRAEELSSVERHSQSCTACVLAEKRSKVVFGSGSANADLMIVGEGPGAQEDRQGLPFVGPAGELLTKMLAAIDFARDEVYIANVVKCRPPGNRDPKPEEVTACSGYLGAQIELIKPRMILALGRVAAQSLLVTSQPLGRMRGRWHEYRGVPVWVTYHPAALLRNASYKRPTWEDLQFIRDWLAQGGD